MDVATDEGPDVFNKNNNQFIGILVSIISSEIYNRYSGVELPKAQASFSKKRLVTVLYFIF